jgi:two-component system NtrC family sensor kinase
MKKRLFFRVFAAMFGLSLVAIALFGYFFGQQENQMILKMMQAQAETVSRSIELVSADAMVVDDKGMILENNLNILKKSPNIRYIVISQRMKGDTIVTTKNGWRIEKLQPDIRAMQADKSLYTIKQTPFSDGKRVFHYVYPLVFNGFHWGWLHLGFDTREIETLRNDLLRQGLLTVAFILLITLIGAYAFSRWLTRPIIELNDTAKRVAQGDLNVRVQTDRRDEVGEMIGNVNLMIQNLRDNQKMLQSTNRLLEEKVELRTRELQQLNEELEKRVIEKVEENREKDKMLIQQSRLAAMGEMIGNIAHQWRQPLNSLGLVMQNIQIAYDTGRLDADYIDRVTQKGMKLIDSMSHTIDDFRNFFKPNKAKESFDVADALASALDLVESSFKNHRIDVTMETEKNLVAYGFPSEFSQVILNILVNAKDALIEREVDQKWIGIHAFRDSDDIAITIEDNAGGIAKDVIEKIFDPYFTTKDANSGTGLGLYMSKIIISRNMNGQIFVQNSELGAKFTIKIPTKESLKA